MGYLRALSVWGNACGQSQARIVTSRTSHHDGGTPDHWVKEVRLGGVLLTGNSKVGLPPFHIVCDGCGVFVLHRAEPSRRVSAHRFLKPHPFVPYPACVSLRQMCGAVRCSGARWAGAALGRCWLSVPHMSGSLEPQAVCLD